MWLERLGHGHDFIWRPRPLIINAMPKPLMPLEWRSGGRAATAVAIAYSAGVCLLRRSLRSPLPFSAFRQAAGRQTCARPRGSGRTKAFSGTFRLFALRVPPHPCSSRRCEVILEWSQSPLARRCSVRPSLCCRRKALLTLAGSIKAPLLPPLLSLYYAAVVVSPGKLNSYSCSLTREQISGNFSCPLTMGVSLSSSPLCCTRARPLRAHAVDSIGARAQW